MENTDINTHVKHFNVRNTDDRSERLLLQTIAAPLPYIGCTNSPLGHVPELVDSIQTRYNQNAYSMTTWNTQSRHYVAAWSHRQIAAEVEVEEIQQPAPISILQDGALQQVCNACTDISTATKQKLARRRLYLGSDGVYYHEVPRRSTFRSAVYQQQDLNRIIAAIRTGTPRRLPPEFHNAVDADPEPPAKHVESATVPVRSVLPQSVTFQGLEPVSPPKSHALIALEQMMADTNIASKTPFLPSARGVLPRDVPSFQEVIMYSNPVNTSYIDTAPALRGLLYVFPSHADIAAIENVDQRFIRSRVENTRSDVVTVIHQTPQADQLPIRAIAMTMPAFAAHTKNLDNLLSAPGENGIPMSSMDAEWTVVPFASEMLGQPWLLEYLLMFTTSEVWTGRLCRMWNNNYQGGENVHPTSKKWFLNYPRTIIS